MKNIRKIIAIMLTLTLILGCSITTIAKEQNENNKTDLEKPIIFEEVVEENEIEEDTVVKSNKYTNPYWSQFSRPYYEYVDMTSEQINAYNKIYNYLYSLIEGGEDITEYYEGYYITPEIEVSGLTKEEVTSIALLMLYDHPELYYLDASIKINIIKGTNRRTVQFAVYDDFTSASSRYECSQALKNKIESIKPLITGATPYEKEKQIHDLIIKNTIYDANAPYSQSIVSVFLEGKTVCAGYSESFAALCHSLNIPAISVVSERHEWNQVYLDGLWYAVDLTWDDDDNEKMSYICFNVSDNTLHGLDKKLSNSSHTKEVMYEYVKKPNCDYDYKNRPAVKYEKSYRLYNQYTGEHFYTTNEVERFILAVNGWNDEGIAWETLQIADAPVYRLYNPSTGQHHYTKSEQEKAILTTWGGWNDEGISFYTKSIDEKNNVYRLYNQYTGWHHYTTNEGERDWLIFSGWQYEGISWKVS